MTGREPECWRTNSSQIRFTFPQQCRLTEPADFRAAFSKGRTLSSGNFVIRVRPNGQEVARLGMIVAKRLLPRAVDRNRVRRGVRETFRRRRVTLAGLDVVVRLRARAIPGVMLDGELAAMLDKLVQ